MAAPSALGAGASPALGGRYSLVIPTYNRPDDLRRLLGFLAFQKAAFPILVLDSSRPEVHERNAATIRSLALDARLERFDPSLPPWEKFRRGSELVATEFSSMCADDDLLMVSSLGPIVDFLAHNRAYGVAHGWYFEFYLSGALGLTKVVYRSPSIEAEQPIERLHQLLAGYEALTYGVHRTALLRDIMDRVRGVQTMLGRELLGGALAVVAGKVARLPLLYAGRSLGPSAGYSDSTPFDFLMGSPRTLFEEYGRYRDILSRYWAACGHGDADIDRIDFAHLRYVSDYFKPAVLDYVHEQLRLGRRRQEILDGIWPVFLDKRGLEGALHRSRLLRLLRDRFAPWVRGYHVRKFTRARQYRVVSGALAAGGTRDYHIHRELEVALQDGRLNGQPEGLIGALAGYA